MKLRPSKHCHFYRYDTLLKLKDVSDLAKMLYISFNSMEYLVKNASYTSYTIPKKMGGLRTIEAPNDYLKKLQRELNKYLMAYYFEVRPYVSHGFAPTIREEKYRPNIVTNAKVHVGKTHLLNIDLKDFFHSISTTQVRNFFMSDSFNFNNELATAIALICCWQKRLPMGAPTSPVLSNLLCLELDKEITQLAIEHNLDYTRYADDLTFSSNYFITVEMLEKIKSIIVKHNFIVNEKKLRMQSKYSQQTVTGIKVNEKLNVNRNYIRNIRAILNDIERRGIEQAACKNYKIKHSSEKLVTSFYAQLSGKINFIGQVRGKEDLIYNKLRQSLREVSVIKTLN